MAGRRGGKDFGTSDRPARGGDAIETLADTRRQMLAKLGVAGAWLAFPGIACAQRPRTTEPAVNAGAGASAVRGPFFTQSEFALLDEIAERIIPQDEVSGGARAAGVARLIDARVGEMVDPAERKSWRDDLAEIDRVSQVWFGQTFLRLDIGRRDEVLRRLSRNEKAPKAAGEFAFQTIKFTVADAYYRTRTGIHDDLKYQGNAILDAFIGTDIGDRR